MRREATVLALAVLIAAAAAAPWDIAIAPEREPGRRLIVSGVVRNAPGSPPLSGVSVYAYHADGKGLYARQGEEKKGPRLAGTLLTGPGGRYRIRTVFPGTYGGPPHVHFEVWGKGIARRAFALNLAAPGDDPPRPSEGSSWIDRAIRERHPTAQGMVAPFLDAQGVLHVSYDLVLRNGYPVSK